ncbi:fibroblast growth factor 17-like [Stegodyphus dumicola]|uniref:fibroblast growth factor 17-like n=1 Tax=Stegodyphus dumicola TaxID=202533 RepID=UPI0015B18561|nr:fibroblast growth factor 17-like [Stegodyphus dumicola]
MLGERSLEIVLAFFIALVVVSCEEFGGNLLEHAGKKYLTNSVVHFKSPKPVHFFNYCSEKQLEITGNSVSASGDQIPNTNIILQPVYYHNHYGVNIIGESSRRFICFDKKSKLITRVSGESPRCIFEEIFSPDEMYTMLRSVFKKNWFIGFNRKGKPKLGSKYVTGNWNKCYYFTKRGHSYFNLHKHRHTGPKILHPEKLYRALEKQRLMQRRKVANG